MNSPSRDSGPFNIPTFRFVNGSYPFQFTIRSRLPSGAETELSKIVHGKGDWMFYGHASSAQSHVENWWLIDLSAFRAGLIRQASNGWPIPCGDQMNPDGTWFKWFDIRSFPKEPRLVVACSTIH